uniref:Uncharacterized protein n=1 Tax=Aegilops tauschii TaxID=37682 RepID=M8C4W5_AEGTA
MPSGWLCDLRLNFWDAGDASDRPVAINSGCVAPQHEKSSQSSAATATNSFLCLCPGPWHITKEARTKHKVVEFAFNNGSLSMPCVQKRHVGPGWCRLVSEHVETGASFQVKTDLGVTCLDGSKDSNLVRDCSCQSRTFYVITSLFSRRIGHVNWMIINWLMIAAADDEDDLLGSIFSKRPTLAEEPPVLLLAPAEAEPLLSASSSSSCHADPPASDAGGARAQGTTTEPSGARAPPLPRCSSSSLKRATPEAASDSAEAECSQSGGKRRKVSASVLCPFAVLKPDGLDGGATLADINARILMRPARPVRHPVGEYACAPRVLAADAPGISGRAVSGFTRLHTPGRGTITIMRTRG